MTTKTDDGLIDASSPNDPGLPPEADLEPGEYLLYDGTVKLSFTPSGHRYRVQFIQPDGEWTKPRPTVGTTTVLGFKNKYALVGWAARLAAEKFYKLAKDKKVTVALGREIIEEAKVAHSKARDAAGDFGTNVHKAIQMFLLDEDIPKLTDKEQKAFDAFTEWWDEGDYEVLGVEKPVYSKEKDLAGTFDVYFLTPTGQEILADFKTTKVSKWAPDGVYVENFAQLGGYASSLLESSQASPTGLWVINVGKDGKIRVVRNEDINMSVNDAIDYFNNIYTAWKSDKFWEYELKSKS